MHIWSSDEKAVVCDGGLIFSKVPVPETIA
jgi:hypothetical protein